MALVNKTFSDIITFTRASTATYFNSAGVLTSAATNAPRFDYDPVTLAARGLLIEESRTNLCLQSADFFENGTGVVNWIWVAGVITGNTQVAPDGTTTADTCTAAGGVQSVYQSITVTASTSYTFSVFVKLGTMNVLDYKIAIYNNTAANFIATDVVPSQVPNTSSWTRVTYTFTTPVGCTSIRVYPFRNSLTFASSTVFLWGAQLEAGAFPTSYIPTTTTALTRAADVASVNTLSPWFNSVEGTLYSETQLTRQAAVAGTNTFYISNGSINELKIFYRATGATGASAVDTGVDQANLSPTGVLTANTIAKIAFAYKANDFAASGNGGAAVTDTSGIVPGGMSQVLLGQPNGILNGHIRRITYYPRRPSNAELQAITA